LRRSSGKIFLTSKSRSSAKSRNVELKKTRTVRDGVVMRLMRAAGLGFDPSVRYSIAFQLPGVNLPEKSAPNFSLTAICESMNALRF
jgi:hypothetical protein